MKNILLSIHLFFIDSIVYSQFLQPEDQTSSRRLTEVDNIKDFYCVIFDMDSRSELHLEEGIPSEYNEKQTLRAVQKRRQIFSQREEKNSINDFPEASAARQVLERPTRVSR
jgi:hypothetical protein